MSEWQPIETAPKDGTAILLLMPSMDVLESIVVGRWDTEWMNGQRNMALGYMWIYPGNREGGSLRLIEPTHWQPLPQPPKETAC